MNDVYILAIESSCDETSMAIVKNGREVISMCVNTQMKTHALYGGVVPEIASRMHTENITRVLDEVLKNSNLKMDKISAIAVTYAPGLLGSLLVGVECAKVLSLVHNKPLIAVNHLAGHIYANNIDNKMSFPLLALVVSGGHTDLILMKGDYDFQVVGKTLDDAIGECYDKVARVLGVSYPGGPNVEKLALAGAYNYKLPKMMVDDSLNLSFSGLKSAVINLVHNEKQRGNDINKGDLAYCFQYEAIDEIERKVRLALVKYDVKELVVAGGVSANSYLREKMEKVANDYHIKISIPDFKYCTDNAAMIGAAAYPLYLKNEFSDLDLNAKSQLDLY